jgi:hypothetical protein
MEKWVAQHASDDTEAVQLLQLATNAVENFDNYMAYGTEMNEELSMKDITSGQRSYQQMKPYFIAKVIGLKPETEQKASELVLKKSKAFPGMTQIIKTAKTPEEVENVVFFDGYPDEDQTIRFSGLEYELYQVTPNPKIDRLKEEASGLEFKVGDKVTYLGHPGTITNAGTDIMDRPIYSVSYNKGTGDTKVTNVYNKGGSIKPMKENSLNLSDATLMNKSQFLQLLEQEVEDFIQTQAEKVVKFEDDPMAYILQKYPSLQGTLEDLMTSSFEDYITGIYVMAPKPTTFKVLLHNGQQFYLIYARDSYIAKIAGKKYYLLNLGEEEYAIKAIAELLTMGKPPGSQGPDAEEENTTNAGEEASAEEVPAEGGDEGGEEELAETKEKDPIVKAKTPTLKFKILKESVEKKKSPLKFRI